MNSKTRKLQYLLINQLLEEGSVQLILPDGMTLEIDILQEDKNGEMKKTDNYCSIVASRQGKKAILDSFNLSLQYEQDDDIMVFEHEICDLDGRTVKSFDVV